MRRRIQGEAVQIADDLGFKMFWQASMRMERQMEEPVFPIHLSEEDEQNIAVTLAKVCHFVHPSVVQAIRKANEADSERLAAILPVQVDRSAYLYPSLACIFPGVRRYVGKLPKGYKHKYVKSERAILDGNEFPRHVWAYLAGGVSYNGKNWSRTGLNEFELAQVFAHKIDERRVERLAFRGVNPNAKPDGLFTCASNTVLVPRGLAKPTDHLESVKKAFFKRYVDLYGEAMLPGLSDLNEAALPSWFSELKRSEPILPTNWELNVEKLRRYRLKRLKGIFSKPLEE